MVKNKQKVPKDFKTFQTSCSEDLKLLYLSKLQVVEEYETWQEKCTNGKTATRSKLISSNSTVLEEFVLNLATKEEIKELRKGNMVSGIIFKKDGRLYYSIFTTGDESIFTTEDEQDKFITNSPHLCGHCIIHRDTVCEKILNLRCNHIELYDFIRDGYERFSPHSQSIFYVMSCDKYYSTKR